MSALLFGARGGAATTSDLYSIDPDTGAVTSIGPLGYALDGLAWDPTDNSDANLYGATTATSTAHPRSLIRINRVTGAATFIGAFHGDLTATMYDIAFRSDGTLWGTSRSGPPYTVTIDKATAAVSAFAPLATGILAFISDDEILWTQTTGAEVSSFNVVTLGASDIGPTTGDYDGTGEILALTYDGATVLFAVKELSGVSNLYSLDIVNPGLNTTLIGEMFPSGAPMDAIEFVGEAPPPPPGRAYSFYQGYEYRTVVTTLGMQTLTILDRLASARSLERALRKPLVMRGQVPSWSPEVNIPHTDGEAFVGFTDRFLFMFRRESVDSPHWIARGAGVILPLSDSADNDNATSSYTAYDPRQVLYARPVVKDGDVISKDWVITGMRGDEIVTTLLDNMASYATVNSRPYEYAFIDKGQGTGYAGTIEATEVIPSFTIQAGQTVGEVFDTLEEDGYCEIILNPIYDPANRPNLIVELNVYQLAGTRRNDAIMAWDKPSRSLVGIERLNDGTQNANVARFHVGSGGPAVSDVVDGDSVARYGEYNTEQYITAQKGSSGAVSSLAGKEIQMRSGGGKRTLSIHPAAKRSPIPFIDYDIGDLIPIYASRNFREEIAPVLDPVLPRWNDLQRIWGFTVTLDDNGTEDVTDLSLSVDTA